MTTVFLNSTFLLAPVGPPRLSNAGPTYDPAYFNDLNNTLRLFFRQVANLQDGVTLSTTLIDGTFPYGAFSSSATHTTATNTATALALNTNDFISGVSVVSGSRITVVNPAVYNLQFSVQLQSLALGPEDVFIWVRQNGVDIVGATGIIGLAARKGAGDPTHGVYSRNYYVSMAAGDYIELYWSTTNGADVTIPFYAASGTPTKPSAQSVVATLSYVSGLVII